MDVKIKWTQKELWNLIKYTIIELVVLTHSIESLINFEIFIQKKSWKCFFYEISNFYFKIK
jgi:hypothetical protein